MDALSRRDTSSVETAFPTAPPMPLRGQNMSRRDTNPVEGRHQADTLSRRDTSSVGTTFTDGFPLGAKHVPQGHKPGRRSPPGGHLDSKGHKLGRNDVHGRVPNAPSGAKHHRLPQLSLSKLRKFMASDKCPIPISGLPSRSATVLATLRILS